MQVHLHEEPGEGDVYFKCVLLGPPGVGKTCLLNRLATGRFLDSPLSTLSSDSLITSLALPGGAEARMELWDTGGQERYRSLTQSYFRGAKAVLLVYDADRKARLGEWLKEVRSYVCRQEALLFLLGTKLDLGDDVRLTEEEVTSLCGLGGEGALEVEERFVLSAKSGEHVHSVFNDIASSVRQAALDDRLDLSRPQGTLRAGKGGNPATNKGGKCC